MRLLILTPEFDGSGGGIIAFYRNLVPALLRLGASVRVIEGSAMHAGERAPRVVEGVAVETLERDRLLRWWDRFPAFAAAPSLRRHLAAAWAMWEQADFGRGADVVEATDWGLLFVPPMIEAVSPLVVQCHGSVGQISVHDPAPGEETDNALERLLESAVLARCAQAQTSSRANSEFWRAETGRAVDVVRPSLTVSDQAPDQAPTDRGLVVGRVQRWKGPDVLCEALASMGLRAPAIDWIGRDTPWGGRETSSAHHLATTFPNHWGRTIASHPPLAPTEIAHRQACALFNLIPSTWDVFNFTVAEAMASRRPTIVSSGAGASELVADGENGYLFAAGDSAALAAAIDRVLTASPARRSDIGRAARETVLRELDPAAIAQSRFAAFQAAIETFHAAPPAPVEGWLGELCRPGAPAPGNDGDFLAGFPIRTIAGHLATRLGDRVGRTLTAKASRR